MKLTSKQQEVLDMMASGWELGSSTTTDGHAWIQQGGIGKGGKSKNVHTGTVQALYDRKLITQKYGFPASTYTLTDLGRSMTR